jgi:hypothetical protein
MTTTSFLGQGFHQGVTTPGRSGKLCALRAAGLLVAALAAHGAQASAPPEWYLHTGGISHHFEETRAANRQWQEQHPGLGLERRVGHDNGWSMRLAGGVMQDSRGFWGGYTGVGYLHRWRLGQAAELGAGAGAYAFYRSVSWSGSMQLIPALLPTASLGLANNAVGLNLVYVPRVGAYSESMTPALHTQVVVRFR